MYINFAMVNPVTYHSLYGFAVGTRMVLQVLWEFPIPGMENTIYDITEQIRSGYSSLTGCVLTQAIYLPLQNLRVKLKSIFEKNERKK